MHPSSTCMFIKYVSLKSDPVNQCWIRIEKMPMRIQEKISMRIIMRMRIHTLTELWRTK
jgi:hypothetical protein